MRNEVRIYRSDAGVVVASVSLVPRRGFFSDGWTEVVPTGETGPARIGETVLAGIARSGTIELDDLPSLGGTGATPASLALGFDTEDALLAAGASHVDISVKDDTWRITPMVNEGPGRGWSGHADAPATVRETADWPVEELGATVIAALDSAQRLSTV